MQQVNTAVVLGSRSDMRSVFLTETVSYPDKFCFGHVEVKSGTAAVMICDFVYVSES